MSKEAMKRTVDKIKSTFWEGYIPEPVKPAQQEPVVFYRCNGCGHAYEEVHPTSCDCMEVGGFDRVEYYTSPPAQQEPLFWFDPSESFSVLRSAVFDTVPQSQRKGWKPLYTSPPAQRTWVDPNDKTQKQYLPHIGEPVLFCHKGAIYTGKHTGGSFQSEVTNQYFNTWECHWMYLPAAHGIKENT